MKKKIAIISSALIVILIAVIGLAAYNANSIISRYKPELENMLSNALGSNVSLGKFEVSIIPRTRVRIDKVKIWRGESEGVTLNDVALALELLPLLSGKLNITQFHITKPALTLVKESGGVYLAGFPRLDASRGARGISTPGSEGSKKEAVKDDKAQVPPIDVELNSFKIEEGKVTFSDKIKGKEYLLSEIAINGSMSLEGKRLAISQLDFNAKLLGETPLAVGAKEIIYTLDVGNLSTALSSTIAESPLNIVLEANSKNKSGNLDIISKGVNIQALMPIIEDFLPQLTSLGLSGSVAPQIKAQFDSGIKYSAAGTLGLIGAGAKVANVSLSEINGTLTLDANQTEQKLSSDNIKLKAGNEPLTLIMQLAVKNNALMIPKYVLAGFGGSINGSFNLAMAAEKRFSATTSAEKLLVEQAIRVIKPEAPELLVGLLHKLDATFKGVLGAEMTNALEGSSRIDFRDGALKGVNIAGAVLKKVDFLGGALSSFVPPEMQDLVNSPDTKIESCTGDFFFGKGIIKTSNLRVLGPHYTIVGDGTVGFDMNMAFNATISFDQKLSAALAGRVKEIGKVLDAEKRLTIPLTLEGTPIKLRVVPNTEKLLELAAKRVIQDKAGDLLKGVMERLVK